jgi:hypothetical protein
LREELIAEMTDLKDGDELALWAYRRLSAKNTLTTDDARIVEAASQRILGICRGSEVDIIAQSPTPQILATKAASQAQPSDQNAFQSVAVAPLNKPTRRRNKAHLVFVASQPCLICQRIPCDAHHLRFAQPKALGRKVSDEFTIPICRDHHHELHRHGNEAAWWANLKIAPVDAARELWQASPTHGISSAGIGFDTPTLR